MKPSQKLPVEEYLKEQKRFRHLKDEQIKTIQDFVDAQSKQFGLTE